MVIKNFLLKFKGLSISLLLIISCLLASETVIAQVLPTWDRSSGILQPTKPQSPQLTQEELERTGVGECQLNLRRMSLQFDREIRDRYQNNSETLQRYQINQPTECLALYIYRKKVRNSIIEQ